MIIDKINLNHLRIFECVYRLKSMTDAAQELHLTQSGVSQHMKSFEDALGVKLFDRINQRLVPTSMASALFTRCAEGLNGIERALSEIKGQEGQLSGQISIGMPIEFGNTLIMPLLSQFSKKHPLVRFKLRLGFASEMNAGLLDGSIDFAFIDEYGMDKRIASEKVYDEVLDLCIDPQSLKKLGKVAHQRKFYESLDYVEYQEGEPLLRMWFHHHLKTRNLDLNVKATVMDVQGVARLIVSGMGAGVLPGHLVGKLQKEGQKLYRFKGTGQPLKNSISVAFLRERTQAPATATALQWLKAALVKAGASPVVSYGEGD